MAIDGNFELGQTKKHLNIIILYFGLKSRTYTACRPPFKRITDSEVVPNQQILRYQCDIIEGFISHRIMI